MNPVRMLLLEELRQDSRKPFSKISREHGIPVTTLFNQYEKLKSEIISKHTSLVDFRKLGYPVRAMVFLKPNNPGTMLEHLSSHRNVNTICRLEDERYSVDVVFESMREYADFLEELANFNIEHMETFDIVEQLKCEGFQVLKK